MNRILMIGTAMLLAVHLAPAAPVPEATETVIRLEVTPMAAPVPALKYQLLPHLREIQQGNSVQNFMKCFMEQNHFFFNKEEVEKRAKYETMPLQDLPAKDLRGYGGIALRQADYAARMESTDWQILPLLRRDGFRTLLPEIQQMRQLASALKVRLRVEIAEKKFDEAIRTTATLFSLARVIGEHPTVIAELVGIAVCHLTIPPLEEMINQPGCPNLYWALSTLPEPMIDLRRGAQAERVGVESELSFLTDKRPMSAEEVQKGLEKLQELFQMMQIGPPPIQKLDPILKTQADDKKKMDAAKQRLASSGLTPKLIEQFHPYQVILLDEKLRYDILLDDLTKYLVQPYWVFEAQVGQIDQRIKSAGGIASSFMPSFNKIRQAQARLQQRLAMLRVVEALRLHAAENGSLPEKLDDIAVPVPVDPVNGKPFLYSLESGKATLKGAAPKGMEINSTFNIRYQISLKK
ncbi:MAG: hypothetical protein ACKO23_18090 [Gemmataceae bacterium]